MLSTTTLIDRIRGEYRSLPGLKLTIEQAHSRWAVDELTCAAALDALIAEGFLQRTGAGKFIALPRPDGSALTIAETQPLRPVRCQHCRKLNMREAGAGPTTRAAFRCAACGRLVNAAAISA